MTDESQWSDEELIAHAREMAAVYADVCSPQVGWLVGLIDRRDAEIERLRQWKREAIEVLGSWDVVSGLVTPAPEDLGRSKSDLVAQEIQRLRAKDEQREATLATYRRQMDQDRG